MFIQDIDSKLPVKKRGTVLRSPGADGGFFAGCMLSTLLAASVLA